MPALAIRQDLPAAELRRLARQEPDRRAAMRLLAIAHALDGFSRAEAAHCADLAVKYSELLRDNYHITKPIEMNNIAVNLGLKKRGLCYQLADDMQAEFLDQHSLYASAYQVDTNYPTDPTADPFPLIFKTENVAIQNGYLTLKVSGGTPQGSAVPSAEVGTYDSNILYG